MSPGVIPAELHPASALKKKEKQHVLNALFIISSPSDAGRGTDRSDCHISSTAASVQPSFLELKGTFEVEACELALRDTFVRNEVDQMASSILGMQL